MYIIHSKFKISYINRVPTYHQSCANLKRGGLEISLSRYILSENERFNHQRIFKDIIVPFSEIQFKCLKIHWKKNSVKMT